MTPALVVQHLGALHPAETALTLALAFGPFLVLGVVALRRRHEDDDADQREPERDPSGASFQ